MLIFIVFLKLVHSCSTLTAPLFGACALLTLTLGNENRRYRLQAEIKPNPAPNDGSSG